MNSELKILIAWWMSNNEIRGVCEISTRESIDFLVKKYQEKIFPRFIAKNIFAGSKDYVLLCLLRKLYTIEIENKYL